MNVTTANVIQFLVVYGTFPSIVCCCALYNHLKKRNRHGRIESVKSATGLTRYPPIPPLPKPKGCTHQPYTDPCKELQRLFDRLRRGLDPNKPTLSMDRVEVQQYLRGKDN